MKQRARTRAWRTASFTARSVACAPSAATRRIVSGSFASATRLLRGILSARTFAAAPHAPQATRGSSGKAERARERARKTWLPSRALWAPRRSRVRRESASHSAAGAAGDWARSDSRSFTAQRMTSLSMAGAMFAVAVATFATACAAACGALARAQGGRVLRCLRRCRQDHGARAERGRASLTRQIDDARGWNWNSVVDITAVRKRSFLHSAVLSRSSWQPAASVSAAAKENRLPAGGTISEDSKRASL